MPRVHFRTRSSVCVHWCCSVVVFWSQVEGSRNHKYYFNTYQTQICDLVFRNMLTQINNFVGVVLVSRRKDVERVRCRFQVQPTMQNPKLKINKIFISPQKVADMTPFPARCPTEVL